MPAMLESPFVGRSPNRLCTADGMRIEPHVSEPHATAAKLAATAGEVGVADRRTQLAREPGGACACDRERALCAMESAAIVDRRRRSLARVAGEGEPFAERAVGEGKSVRRFVELRQRRIETFHRRRGRERRDAALERIGELRQRARSIFAQAL